MRTKPDMHHDTTEPRPRRARRPGRPGPARLAARVFTPAAAVALALVAAAGCASTPDTTDLLIERERRMREARELADKALRAQRKGEIDEAYELYLRSIATSGDLALARNNLGLILLDRQNYLDAVRQFRVAADLQPADPRPQTNIGVAYAEAGWPSDAIVHFEKALRIDEFYLPAIRGAVQSASDIGRGNAEDLERIRLGLLVERDPAWRNFFDRERFRVENLIRLRDERPSDPDVARGDRPDLGA